MFVELAQRAMKQLARTGPDPLSVEKLRAQSQNASADASDELLFGLDLGQVSDYSALGVAQKSKRDDPARPGRQLTHYAISHLQRWPLGTSYPDIVANVADLLAKVEGARLIVDQTGVGRAVVDMCRRARLNCKLVAVTITGGHEETVAEDRSWHVPKKNLVSAVQAALQTDRLKIARALREARTLKRELQTFRVKVDALTKHESFESWRERDHDDMVLAVALAVWWGERPRFRPDVYLG